jgi:hypothetical protein
MILTELHHGCISSHSGSVFGSIHAANRVHARIHVAEGHLSGGRVCGSCVCEICALRAHIYLPLLCLSLGCSLGWPAGVRAFQGGRATPLDLANQGTS